jgi:hypothetical protein
MNKNKKILIGLGSFVVIGIGAYMLLRKDIKSISEKEDLLYDIDKEASRLAWEFEDNIWTGDESNQGKSISSLGFIGKTKPPFKKGESVEIIQNAGAKYDEYNAVMLIEDIYQTNGKWVINVDGYRVGDTPVNGGVAKSIV